ncbi:MAG: glycosyltransferase family 2 protein [Bacteroidota bacterium]
MSSVAVVIPVKDGFPEIKACIESILEQTVKVNRILVVDSGSTDGTICYLETVKEVELLKIDPSAFNHGETRNIGWRHCTEDFIFYTVQDARAVNKTLLEELLKGFTDEEVAAVCGQQIVPHDKDKNPVEWFRPLSPPVLLRYQFKNAEEFGTLTPERKNSICSWDDVVAVYRSSVLRKIPFQRTVFGEDMIWAKEAILNGYAITYNQAARVYHYHLESPDSSFKRSFTTMYFRYKQFRLMPVQPVLTLRRKLSIIKCLLLSLSPSVKDILKWYRYNTKNYGATIKSYRQFVQSLRQGEEALDNKHTALCGIPPSPLKAI